MVISPKDIVPKENTPEPMPLGGYDEIRRLGQALAASGYFQDAKDANQAVAKILAGREMGIGPLASLVSINIIKGRISISANLMAAQVKRSRRYDYRVHTLDDRLCDLEFYEHGRCVGHSVFTMEDAHRANLDGGENWRHYPQNMLYSRAMSNGVKLYCPDVLIGPAYTPDELGAVIDTETGAVLQSAEETGADVPPSPADAEQRETAPEDLGKAAPAVSSSISSGSLPKEPAASSDQGPPLPKPAGHIAGPTSLWKALITQGLTVKQVEMLLEMSLAEWIDRNQATWQQAYDKILDLKRQTP